MTARVLKKREIDENVYDVAVRRFDTLFDRFDRVVVSFSGGKDSTVCLNLSLEAAARAGKLPLDVYFWDEEAIHPETVEYVHRVAARPDVRFKWLCIPIEHRNACSRKQPYWYPWNPAEKHLWVREMPEFAITELPHFKMGMSVPELAAGVYGPEAGTVADIRGLRADESLRRYMAVSRKLIDNWIGGPRDGYSFPCSPIYDWSTIDVWTAPKRFGWDYNRAYDVMAKAGISPSNQRVCPPFGEEPLGNLVYYAICWPDLWDRMLNRVHGARTAGRYARTELYGFGGIVKPDGLSYRQWAFQLLDLYPPALRAKIAKSTRSLIAMHKERTRRPIREVDADILTGISWRYIAMLINRGDLKQRRKGNMTVQASLSRGRQNLSLEDASDIDGGLDAGTRY